MKKATKVVSAYQKKKGTKIKKKKEEDSIEEESKEDEEMSKVKIKAKSKKVVVEESDPEAEESIVKEEASIIIKEGDKEIVDVSKFIKMQEVKFDGNQIILKCFKQGSKLRVRILSEGYYNDANCQCARDIREPNAIYAVSPKDIELASSKKGTYYYRIKNLRMIQNAEVEKLKTTKIQIFEDKTTNDCCICLDLPKAAVFVPCGHYYTCMDCSTKIYENKCPICRAKIIKSINKQEMN